MPNENQGAEPASSNPNPAVLSSPTPQPQAMVNGQPYSPQSPLLNSQPEPDRELKPSKWRYFFIVLGVLQALGVAIFIFTMLWASQQAKAGMSGTEFIGLILFFTLVPAITVIALINLIGLPIYIHKQKPTGKHFIFCCISLLISGILALFGAFSASQMFITGPRYVSQLSEESDRKSQLKRDQFLADNAKPEITKEAAVELLKTCKLKGFYYTDQVDKSDPSNGGWGELSSTGVVLTKIDGEPYRISIADRLIPELVPVAREAQRTCTNPQFYHDGSYEQFENGKWYFGDEVVNAMETGKTKAEAVSLLQSCKVDYFVGYTNDLSPIKESSTRSWLEKAEASTTGLEILADSPQTYLFASKAMTAEMQDTVRQYRQSCYTTKKIYIAIDGFIETEYPAGKWTRIKQ